MKAFNKKKSYLSFIIVPMMIVGLMTACPADKKGTGGTPGGFSPIPCPPNTFCPQIGGVIGGYPLGTGFGSLDSNPQGSYISLTFSGNQQVNTGTNVAPPYQGPVTAVGEIYIVPGICISNLAGQPFPAGKFPISVTTQPGQWTNGIFSNLVVQAANGMLVSLPNNSVLYESGSNPPLRIKDPIYISMPGFPQCVLVAM
jgi:hypothetical protein